MAYAPSSKGSKSKASKSKYHLKNMLVVIICVGEYDMYKKKPGDNNLPGTQSDKSKLLALFKDEYSYKVLSHNGARVTAREMRKLLNKARMEFSDNEYDGIIVCFSGHGDAKHLLCSDYGKIKTDSGKKRTVGIFTRQDFEQFFNGHNCPDEIAKYKFYFVDACPGGQDTPLITNNHITARGTKVNSIGIHPEANKCIMYGNANYYVTLETTAGGMLTNAVVDVFKLSLSKSISFGKMQDKIRKIAANSGDNDGGILPPVENNIDYSTTGKITFGPKKPKKKVKKETNDMDDEKKQMIIADIQHKIDVIQAKYSGFLKKLGKTDDDIFDLLEHYNFDLQKTMGFIDKQYQKYKQKKAGSGSGSKHDHGSGIDDITAMQQLFGLMILEERMNQVEIEKQRREKEKRDRLRRQQQELNKNNANCPSGHKLKVFVPGGIGFRCNGCMRSIPSNVKIYGCRVCDYDLCGICHEKKKRAYGGMNDVEQQFLAFANAMLKDRM